MVRPVSSLARNTSSWSMWLFISAPAKPASFTAFIFSSTDPFMATVPHMIAFFSSRLPDATGSPFAASALNPFDASAAAASAPALPLRNSRRFIAALGELRDSWHRNRRDRHRRVPRDLRRDNALFRIHRLFPGDFLARIGGHAAHDRQQRAVRHADAIIDRLPLADAREELVMLVLIHVRRLVLAKLPGVLAFNDKRPAERPHDLRHAICAHEIIGIIAKTLFLLATGMKTAHTVRVFIDDRKMIEDVAVFRCRPDLPAAQSHALHRRLVLHHPSHFVNAMHRLLDNVIARKPCVIIPVLHLILQVGPVRLPGKWRPHRSRVIDGVNCSDFANGAIVDLLHDGAHTVIVAVTKTGYERQVL